MSVTARASSPRASPPASRPTAPATWPSSSTKAPPAPRPGSSPPTASRRPRCCGRSRCCAAAGSRRSCSTAAAPTPAPARSASRTPTPPPRRSPRCSATPREVAVCSTGLIGEPLPMDKVLAGIELAAGAAVPDGGLPAADAIRTTDTVSKISFRRGEGGYMVGGMAKGAGMLAPGLATMLSVITTDADLPADVLDAHAAPGGGGHLRPGGHRRLHVHQRHRAAARQRRHRRPPDPDEFTARSPRSARPRPPARRATPRAPPRRSRSR